MACALKPRTTFTTTVISRLVLVLHGVLGRREKVAPKTVLRAGFGIFYDRVPYNLVLQTERLNGFTQQQTIVAANPAMGQNSPTSYQFASSLRAPSTMQTAVSVERQVAKSTTVAVTYINSYGEHQLFLRNAKRPSRGLSVIPSGRLAVTTTSINTTPKEYSGRTN